MLIPEICTPVWAAPVVPKTGGKVGFACVTIVVGSK